MCRITIVVGCFCPVYITYLFVLKRFWSMHGSPFKMWINNDNIMELSSSRMKRVLLLLLQVILLLSARVADPGAALTE